MRVPTVFDHSPPETLQVGGRRYPIRTDFRDVLRYDQILREDTGDGKCLERALILMYGLVPEPVAEAVERLNWFIRCGEEEKKHKPSPKLLGINHEKPMDYEKDARLIWSAFRRVYQMDLTRTEYLHWWDFQGMLEELPEDIRLNRVIRYRTIDTKNKRLSKEERELYEALQRYYRIRETPTEQQERIAEALRNGEDPAPYL